MTGVALLDRLFDEASAPESSGESRLCATSVAQNSCRHELFGLDARQYWSCIVVRHVRRGGAGN
jgi:hypothetical protein